jgi:hypothetical protein
MKERLLRLRKVFLQGVAEFILLNMEFSITQQQFEQWLWMGLWLDAWCVERNIWLN